MNRMNDIISRKDAISAIWKALYEYEDKTEKQFQESDELDLSDWLRNDRIWVQNGHNLCVNVLANLQSAQQWIPCDEQLPKKKCRCILLNSKERISGGVYLGDKTFSVDYSDEAGTKVEAWMPCPESLERKGKEDANKE